MAATACDGHGGGRRGSWPVSRARVGGRLRIRRARRAARRGRYVPRGSAERRVALRARGRRAGFPLRLRVLMRGDASMTQRSLLRVVAVLGVTLCSAGVRAEHHSMHEGGCMGGAGMGLEPGPGMMFPMILRSIGMSAEQQTKVQAIMDAHRPRFQELFGQLRAAHEDVMAKLLAPGPLTADDLKAPVKRAAGLRDQLTQEGIDVALEGRGLLTADQLAKAADVRQRLGTLRAEMKKLLGDPPLMAPGGCP